MRRAGLFVVLLALLAIATPGLAIVVIDFGTGNAGPGGTATVSGGNVTGVNIPVDSMIVIGSPSADGTYATFGGAVDAGNANGSAALSFDTAASTISIVGGVCVLGDDTCNGGANTLVSSTTLLSGTISSFSLSGAGGPVLSITATGPDTKSSALLSALGIPASTPFSYLVFNFSSDVVSPFGPTYTATSTDLINTEVPEPASIALFGTAVFSCCALLRRRLTAGR